MVTADLFLGTRAFEGTTNARSPSRWGSGAGFIPRCGGTPLPWATRRRSVGRGVPGRLAVDLRRKHRLDEKRALLRVLKPPGVDDGLCLVDQFLDGLKLAINAGEAD